MKKLVVIFFSVLILNEVLNSQDNKTVIVRAGTKVSDYFSFSDKFLYPDFIPGKVVLKSGRSNEVKLNYDMLLDEIEFVQSGDTLAISRKKDLKYVASQDTFYYDNGYIKIIYSGKVRVGMKQCWRIKDILKIGAFGTRVRGGTAESVSSLQANGLTYGLIPNEDMEIQKSIDYYLCSPSGDFIPFIKKNTLQLFPAKSNEIKAYLKSNKVNFNSQKDLLLFAGWLSTL